MADSALWLVQHARNGKVRERGRLQGSRATGQGSWSRASPSAWLMKVRYATHEITTPLVASASKCVIAAWTPPFSDPSCSTIRTLKVPRAWDAASRRPRCCAAIAHRLCSCSAIGRRVTSDGFLALARCWAFPLTWPRTMRRAVLVLYTKVRQALLRSMVSLLQSV